VVTFAFTLNTKLPVSLDLCDEEGRVVWRSVKVQNVREEGIDTKVAREINLEFEITSNSTDFKPFNCSYSLTDIINSIANVPEAACCTGSSTYDASGPV
jgi:hypothetical protein